MGYRIIGFNGRPVAIAMGVKVPVVLDEENNRVGLAIQGKLPNTWWPKDSLRDLLESALYTPCGDLGIFEEGALVLYATSDFITGSDEACTVLEVPSEMTWLDPFYVGYVQPSRARVLIDDWALTLLKASNTACSREAYSLAYIEHCRTGFALVHLSNDHARAVQTSGHSR